MISLFVCFFRFFSFLTVEHFRGQWDQAKRDGRRSSIVVSYAYGPRFTHGSRGR